MYVVRFTPARVVEYSDLAQFELRTRRFMLARETENSNVLGIMQQLVQKAIPALGFTLEEDNLVVGAGVLFLATGSVVLTWTTQEALAALVHHAREAEWKFNQVFGPAHCAHFFARDYAKLTGQTHQFGRPERVYQLTRVAHQLPENGHLQVAVEADLPVATRWMEGFVIEAHYESQGATPAQLAAQFIEARCLYFWKAPRAVSMAAWVCPTPSGSSINFVYTPPELRGRGYGKAVTAALAGQMLAGGVKLCAIRTDSDDAQANAMYQAIGAQTVGEFARCVITPRVTEETERSVGQSKPLALL